MGRPLIRALTSAERRLAAEAVGGGIDCDPVRLLAAPWPIVRAFVPGRLFGRDWIVWPARSLPNDFTTESVARQAVLVHELVHVWQAQQGVKLLAAKLKAGDSRAAYAYAVSDDCVWDGLNIEQQAMMVEHRFRLARGGPVPASREFYDRVCPLGRSEI